MGKFTCIADITKANKALGHHFFDGDTLQCFDSVIEPYVYGGSYFLTSEHFHPSESNLQSLHPSKWTIRRARPNGSIETVNGFQHYASVEEAAHDVSIISGDTPGAVVYLLCFDTPVWGTTRHYVGYTARPLQDRIKEHASGRGNKISKQAKARDIGFTISHIEVFKDRTEARKRELEIKRNSHYDKLCSRCGGS